MVSLLPKPRSCRRGASPGFTAAELMMVVAVVGIIASLAPKMLIEVNRFFLLNRARVDMQREARTNMALITRSLRQAQSNTIRIDRASGQPYYSRISFTKENGDQITYYQSGKSLMMTDGSISKTLSSGSLRYLVFALPRSDDLGIVSVSMTFEKPIFEGRYKALHLASEKVRVMNT